MNGYDMCRWMDVTRRHVIIKPLSNFFLAYIMDNKSVTRDALRKRKVRKNETPDQSKVRLAKQRENNQQKRIREDADDEQREARRACDRERKCVKLAKETDE